MANAWDTAVLYWTGTNVSKSSMAGCKIMHYIGNIARDCSNYIVLGFTIDRFISVRVPLKKRLWITKSRVQAYLVLLVVMFATMEAYVPYYLEFVVVKGEKSCMNRSEKDMTRCTSYVQNVVGFVLPATIVFVLNILIIHQLSVWATQRHSMMGKEGKSEKPGQGTNTALTVLLVAISSWSFIVSTPKTVVFFYRQYFDTDDIFSERGRNSQKALYITDSIRLLNFSCNFFFYCLSGSQFRDDLFRVLYKIVCCRGE